MLNVWWRSDFIWQRYGYMNKHDRQKDDKTNKKNNCQIFIRKNLNNYFTPIKYCTLNGFKK